MSVDKAMQILNSRPKTSPEYIAATQALARYESFYRATVVKSLKGSNHATR